MKSGFTLVELLAVIVILAVLALIATPVVLSIIDDTKESAMLRSAEMYLSGVENAVMRENMNSGGNFRPSECTITNGNMTCGATTVEVEVDGEVPSTGSIVFENGKIKEVTLNYESGTIIKDSNGNLVYQTEETEEAKTLDTICTYDSTNGVAEKTAGAKYSCEVKEGTSYTFYVLTTPAEGDTTINLIMDRNICEDGTPTDASKEDKCTVEWINQTDYELSGGTNWSSYIDNNMYGPVTALNYLYNATKDWSNVPNMEINYTDEGSTGDYGYGKIITQNNITKISKKDGTSVKVLINQEGYIDLKARLPYKSEITSYDSTNKTYAYLYDYLMEKDDIQTNSISGISGYWTLSAVGTRSDFAVNANYFGFTVSGSVSNSDRGVRPVINLKI